MRNEVNLEKTMGLGLRGRRLFMTCSLEEDGLGEYGGMDVGGGGGHSSCVTVSVLISECSRRVKLYAEQGKGMC